MVTITGGVGVLANNIYGTAGIAGASLELTAMHPSGLRPSYELFTSSLTSEARPQVVELDANGGIVADTEVVASAALRPSGSFYRATWTIPSDAGGEADRIVYDLWIGPNEGTCDITDPVNWIASTAPVIAGWPETAPLIVYSAEGTP